MSTNSINETDEQYYKDRQSMRKNVSIDGYIRPLRGSKSLVKILDVSETGFRMITPILYDANVTLYLTIPGFQAMEAQIIWSRDGAYGCNFIYPLHYAVLDHIGKIFAEKLAG